MNRTSLMDQAGFVLQLSVAIAALAGIAMGIIASQVTTGTNLFEVPAFVALVLAEAGAVLLLLWSVVLYVAHRHNETERCPDPSAHRAHAAKPERSEGDTPATPKPMATARPGRASVRPVTVPEPIAAEPADDTIDVDVTPQYLWSLFEGRTGLDGQKLVAKYLGKRMRIEGPLGDILSSTNDWAQVTFPYAAYPHHIYMYFTSEKSVDRMSVIPVGTHIVVRGRLKEVSAIDLHITDCELVAQGASEATPA